jgi:hypothetical protein
MPRAKPLVWRSRPSGAELLLLSAAVSVLPLAPVAQPLPPLAEGPAIGPAIAVCIEAPLNQRGGDRLDAPQLLGYSVSVSECQ